MYTDNHRLISDLSEKYASEILRIKSGKPFVKGDIAAAYIIGAEETLRRVSNIIRHSAKVGGISPWKAATLLRAIEQIESMNHEQTSAKEN